MVTRRPDKRRLTFQVKNAGVKKMQRSGRPRPSYRRLCSICQENTHVYTHICLHTYTEAHAHTCTHTHMYITHAFTHIQNTNIYIYTYTHMHKHTYTHTHARIHICIHTCRH